MRPQKGRGPYPILYGVQSAASSVTRVTRKSCSAASHASRARVASRSAAEHHGRDAPMPCLIDTASCHYTFQGGARGRTRRRSRVKMVLISTVFLQDFEHGLTGRREARGHGPQPRRGGASWRGRAAVVSYRHCGVLLTLLWQCAQSYVLKSARPDGAYAPFLKRILRAERSGAERSGAVF